MVKKINITLEYNEDINKFLEKNYKDVYSYQIISSNLDARNASRGRVPTKNYIIEIRENKTDSVFTDKILNETFPKLKQLDSRPIIIGTGPAGLFCAIRLAEYGIPSLLLERGGPSLFRMKEIAKFWKKGNLNLENNVCFGEGGAGLFSDGKLTTRVKSPYIKYVMKKLVSLGAPKEILYTKDPHVGSNKIRQLISKITNYLKENNVEIKYHSRVDDFVLDTEQKKIIGVKLENGNIYHSNNIVLATGHSSKIIYDALAKNNIALKEKPYAVGVRIEHPRQYIDKLQYGSFADDKILGASRYRLSYHNKQTSRGTYTFCMCPGGYVLSAGTEATGLVINGMSNYAQNARWTNSGMVVSVLPEDFKNFSSAGPLQGLHFRQEIEQKAWKVSKEESNGIKIPAITLKEFLDDKKLTGKDLPLSSCPSGIFKTKFDSIFPPFVIEHLQEALVHYDKMLKGFKFDQALLMAPETRTSAPVTVLRDIETLESISHKNLYPCGEGACHAGGITSAAVDGIKVAMAILKKEQQFIPE